MPVDVDGSYPLLGDHSRSGIKKVDPRIVGTHARLCRSIQFLDVAEDVAPEILTRTPRTAPRSTPPKLEPAPQNSRSFMTMLARPLFAIWRLFPDMVRISAYEMLRKLEKKLYGGPPGHSNAQRLPFGLYLKTRGDPDDVRNEFNALKVIREHTLIPARSRWILSLGNQIRVTRSTHPAPIFLLVECRACPSLVASMPWRMEISNTSYTR